MNPLRIFISSVQVMLFADRLEVRSPGCLPVRLTLEKLREAHSSVLGNPLLAESLYLTEYIERMGTGTLDMIRRCDEAGLAEPEFAVTDGFVTTVRRATFPNQVTRQIPEQITGRFGRRPESGVMQERAGVQERIGGGRARDHGFGVIDRCSKNQGRPCWIDILNPRLVRFDYPSGAFGVVRDTSLHGIGNPWQYLVENLT